MASTSIEELRELLDKLTILPDIAAQDIAVARLLTCERTQVLSFLNQHALNLATEDAAYARSLLSADMLLRDGVGIEMALRAIGRDPGENASGTDFIPRLLRRADDRPIALFGTRSPWLDYANAAICAQGGRVVRAIDGFQPQSRYIAATLAHDPAIVLLGLGMPRQEVLAARLAALPGQRLIINGGAILDFYAGRFMRAPRWLRSARLEWAFRLAQEPRRLSGRYIAGGHRFALTVARMRQHMDGPRS